MPLVILQYLYSLQIKGDSNKKKYGILGLPFHESLSLHPPESLLGNGLGCLRASTPSNVFSFSVQCTL
jgi:hypothetical protein